MAVCTIIIKDIDTAGVEFEFIVDDPDGDKTKADTAAKAVCWEIMEYIKDSYAN